MDGPSVLLIEARLKRFVLGLEVGGRRRRFARLDISVRGWLFFLTDISVPPFRKITAGGGGTKFLENLQCVCGAGFNKNTDLIYLNVL